MPTIGIKAVLDTISDLKMFILNTIKAGFNVCFKWGIENCFTWETIWKLIGYWESYSLLLINKSISKNYVQLFNFIHFTYHVLQVTVLVLPSLSFILIFVIDYSIVLLTYYIFAAFFILKKWFNNDSQKWHHELTSFNHKTCGMTFEK